MAKKETNEAVVADGTQEQEGTQEIVATVEGLEGDDLMEGFEDIERSFSTLPYLTIVQSSNSDIGVIDGCKPGAFMTTITKDILDNPLELIVYKMWRPRALMPAREDGTFPICSTVDGITGSKYGKCAECDLQGYKDGSCRSQTSFLVAPRNNPNKLLRLTLWKTSARTGTDIIRMLSVIGKEKQLPIYGCSVMLEPKSETGKQGGKYFKFIASMGNVLPKEEIAAIRPNFLEAAEIFKKHKSDFFAMLENNANAATADEEDDFSEGLEASVDGAAAVENPIM